MDQKSLFIYLRYDTLKLVGTQDIISKFRAFPVVELICGNLWETGRLIDWSIVWLIDYEVVLYYCKIVSEYKAGIIVMINC